MSLSTRNFGPFVCVSIDEDTAQLVLNHPKRLNSLSPDVLWNLIKAAAYIEKQEKVKVVVFSGKGRCFSAGADLKGDGLVSEELKMMNARDLADVGRKATHAIANLSAVTVARIHSHCVGGAVVLVSACDIRIASKDVLFCIPELDLGLPLTWGAIPRLIREIGPAMTKELVMTCRRFGAAEAKSIGFVNTVVDYDELDFAVQNMVDMLRSKSQVTLRYTKKQVNSAVDAMTGTQNDWREADAYVLAREDTEGKRVAVKYLKRVFKKNKAKM